jgi:hypothetical protein
MMNERGKSDPAIVAANPANKAEPSAAEPAERRAGTKGNADQQHMGRTQSRETMTQVLARIRQTVPSGLPSHTQGRSRMRESRTYGSVRGAGRNLRPYRDGAWRPYSGGSHIELFTSARTSSSIASTARSQPAYGRPDRSE